MFSPSQRDIVGRASWRFRCFDNELKIHRFGAAAANLNVEESRRNIAVGAVAEDQRARRRVYLIPSPLD